MKPIDQAGRHRLQFGARARGQDVWRRAKKAAAHARRERHLEVDHGVVEGAQRHEPIVVGHGGDRREVALSAEVVDDAPVAHRAVAPDEETRPDLADERAHLDPARLLLEEDLLLAAHLDGALEIRE
eukprot:1164866-Prymnesium_polylepis.1